MSLLDRLLRRSPRAVDPAPAPLDFDLKAPDFIADPYRFFKSLREQAPVYRSEWGPWLISSYELVDNCLGLPELSNAPAAYAIINQKNRERYFCADVANNLIAFMDPPEHSNSRKLLARAFHQYMRKGLPDLHQLAGAQLMQFKGRGRFDVIDDFATPFSVAVISRIFGFPASDDARLKAWTDKFFYLFTQIPSVEIRSQVDQSLKEFRDYLLRAFERREAEATDDFLSLLWEVNQDEGASGMSREALADNCMLLYADGIENVDSGIANALHCLLSQRNSFREIVDGVESISNLVDECLRFESPAQFIGRVIKEDVLIGGQQLKAGQTAFLLLASANRDPSKFTQPDSFDPRRQPNPYLSFGRGKHSCLGGSLVKLELEAALRAIMGHFQSLETVNATPDWQYRMGHRWLGSLPIKYSTQC